jgi:hypothetical protein
LGVGPETNFTRLKRKKLRKSQRCHKWDGKIEDDMALKKSLVSNLGTWNFRILFRADELGVQNGGAL